MNGSLKSVTLFTFMLPMNVIPKVDVAALYGAELEVGVLWVSSILMTLRTSLR